MPILSKIQPKPQYKVGEVTHLKEPYKVEYIDHGTRAGEFEITYKFGGDSIRVPVLSEEVGYGDYEKIRASMEKSKDGYANKLFMYGWAARYFIRITAVRAERLQKISASDCIFEGIYCDTDWNYFENGFDGKLHDTPEEAYASLIDKTNGRGTQDSNPWVWVYDYELTEKPE